MIGKRLSDIQRKYRFHIYTKFLKKEYINDLLNGNIYMKNFGFFIDLENKTRIKGQGDKYEVALVDKLLNVQLYDPKTNMLMGTAKSGYKVERYDVMRKIPIFCVACFKSNDFVITKVDEESINVKLDIPVKDQIMFENTFGPYAVILTPEFKDQMIQASNRDDLGLVFGDTDYQDLEVPSNLRRKDFEQGSDNIFFWKDKYFDNQRETRFVLKNKIVEDHYIMKLGELSNKTKVLTTKELFTDTELIIPKSMLEI